MLEELIVRSRATAPNRVFVFFNFKCLNSTISAAATLNGDCCHAEAGGVMMFGLTGPAEEEAGAGVLT